MEFRLPDDEVVSSEKYLLLKKGNKAFTVKVSSNEILSLTAFSCQYSKKASSVPML